MGNMSYCRFRNTLIDLQDCADNWDGDEDQKAEPGFKLAHDEQTAKEELMELCRYIGEVLETEEY